MAPTAVKPVFLITALHDAELLRRVREGELELVPITSYDHFWDQRARSEFSAVNVCIDSFVDALMEVASDVFGFEFHHLGTGVWMFLVGRYIIERAYGWDHKGEHGDAFEARVFRDHEESQREFAVLRETVARLTASASILPADTET